LFLLVVTQLGGKVGIRRPACSKDGLLFFCTRTKPQGVHIAPRALSGHNPCAHPNCLARLQERQAKAQLGKFWKQLISRPLELDLAHISTNGAVMFPGDLQSSAQPAGNPERDPRVPRPPLKRPGSKTSNESSRDDGIADKDKNRDAQQMTGAGESSSSSHKRKRAEFDSGSKAGGDSPFKRSKHEAAKTEFSDVSGDDKEETEDELQSRIKALQPSPLFVHLDCVQL
jgi:hypothetical protein